ncbi:MAG: hypothetical protein MUQ00_01790 [Candidatus Aminicenantes bacterium]|nr:hypothetical protein [Candidatus Aminicenantes bacterium]
MTCLILTSLLAAQGPAGAPRNESISKEDMMADMVFLTSDLLKGRAAGTPEVYLSAEFIRARFARIGLKPVRGNSYFQDFWMAAATLAAENSLEIRLNPGQVLSLRPGGLRGLRRPSRRLRPVLKRPDRPRPGS